MKIIWSNFYADVFTKENIKDARGRLVENGMKEEDITDDDVSKILYDDLDLWLQDERDNLDIRLSNPILVIGSLGLRHGRVTGHKTINSCNIKDILSSENDYCKWYSDGKNIKSIEVHHDGIDYCEYREIREGVNIDILLDDLYYNKKISRKKINYYTKSILLEVAKVYGW